MRTQDCVPGGFCNNIFYIHKLGNWLNIHEIHNINTVYLCISNDEVLLLHLRKGEFSTK